MIFQIVSEQWQLRRRTAEYKKIQDTESVGFAEFHEKEVRLQSVRVKWAELLSMARESTETYLKCYPRNEYLRVF